MVNDTDRRPWAWCEGLRTARVHEHLRTAAPMLRQFMDQHHAPFIAMTPAVVAADVLSSTQCQYYHSRISGGEQTPGIPLDIRNRVISMQDCWHPP